MIVLNNEDVAGKSSCYLCCLLFRWVILVVLPAIDFLIAHHDPRVTIFINCDFPCLAYYLLKIFVDFIVFLASPVFDHPWQDPNVIFRTNGYFHCLSLGMCHDPLTALVEWMHTTFTVNHPGKPVCCNGYFYPFHAFLGDPTIPTQLLNFVVFAKLPYRSIRADSYTICFVVSLR